MNGPDGQEVRLMVAAGYGLKTAPLIFYLSLAQYLEDGYTPLLVDKCSWLSQLDKP